MLLSAQLLLVSAVKTVSLPVEVTVIISFCFEIAITPKEQYSGEFCFPYHWKFKYFLWSLTCDFKIVSAIMICFLNLWAHVCARVVCSVGGLHGKERVCSVQHSAIPAEMLWIMELMLICDYNVLLSYYSKLDEIRKI